MDLLIDIGSTKRQVRLTMAEDNKPVAEIILDHHDLEVVLRNLAGARSRIEPAVSKTLEPNPVFGDTTNAPVIHIGLEGAISKRVRVAMRHDGYGWLAFTMGPESALKFAEHLVVNAIKASALFPDPPKIIT